MANKNANLHSAKTAKNDEFYTQMNDIANELKHYRPHFNGRAVLCNCDDHEKSNFFKFFELNFDFLNLKKLIATSYNPNGHGKVRIIERGKDLNGDGKYTKEDIITGELNGDGDFRSEECIEFLKESDIVVTNPPFSLFREFVATLEKYEKKYLVLGNNNAVTYKEIFPLIKDNKMWLGYSANKTMEFEMPDSYERYDHIDANGKKIGKVPAITWFTNLTHDKRNEKLLLCKEYKKYANEYPKYDNYDAINVDKVKDIPIDYEGVMGVPITFLDKYNPNQFEIIGCADANVLPCGWKGISKEFVELYYKQGNTGQYQEGNRLACYIDNNGKAKVPYKRILIRRVNPNG